MVQARTAFLDKEYYRFLKDTVQKKLETEKPQVLVDLGCGQGYYTKSFAQTASHTYGIDLSKDAIQYAAGQDKKTQYIVGSIYDLPFEDESIDTLVSIFTPLPEKEALRVLRPGGHFIVAGPGRKHHYELKEVLYDQVQENDDPPALEGFTLVDREEISRKCHVDDVMELLKMTPYMYRTGKEGIARVEQLQDGLNVTFDFVVSDWRKEK